MSLHICTSDLWKQKLSESLVSLRARPWLLWQVVLGRYDVMASASYRFLSIPKGPFVFYFSPWMILSPSWEQPIDLMIKDCRLRRSEKSLLKTELFSVWFKIISTRTPRKFIPGNCRFFCGYFIVNKTTFVWKSWRPPFKSSKKTNGGKSWSKCVPWNSTGFDTRPFF